MDKTWRKSDQLTTASSKGLRAINSAVLGGEFFLKFASLRFRFSQYSDTKEIV